MCCRFTNRASILLRTGYDRIFIFSCSTKTLRKNGLPTSTTIVRSWRAEARATFGSPTAATSTNYVQMERWVEQVGESERQGEGIRLKWWSVNGHGDQANRRGIPCQSRSRNRSNRSLIEAKCQAQKTQHSRCQGEGPKEQSSSRSSTAHNVKCVSHVTAELEHLLYERKSKTGPCVSPGNGTRTEGARA